MAGESDADTKPTPLPVFGTLPPRDEVEALVRRRINTVLPRLRDGDDWRGEFEVRPILRLSCSADRRPYRLRQWGVWVPERALPVGTVVELVAPGLPTPRRLVFLPHALREQDFEPGE